jgi:hypothetical protein
LTQVHYLLHEAIFSGGHEAGRPSPLLAERTFPMPLRFVVQPLSLPFLVCGLALECGCQLLHERGLRLAAIREPLGLVRNLAALCERDRFRAVSLSRYERTIASEVVLVPRERYDAASSFFLDCLDLASLMRFSIAARFAACSLCLRRI